MTNHGDGPVPEPPPEPIEKRVPEVLFACVHNAGRSQMAAAFARRYAGDRLTIRSGGSDPADRLHPAVVEAMAEVGLSLDGEVPQRMTAEALAAADIVVTMGCGEACPYVPGRRHEDWLVDDPAGADRDRVRAIRDDIDARVRALLASLRPDITSPPA